MKLIKPYDFGNKILADECSKIHLKEILDYFKNNYKELFIESELNIGIGNKIKMIKSKTKFGGFRLWMQCPICKTKTSILYIHPLNKLIGCRKCLNVDYRKHRYKGMVEEKL